MAFLWVLVFIAGVACSKADSLGTAVTIEDFPNVVQVESRVGVFWLQQCAGSVLTSYHILSAASCFTHSYETVSLVSRRVRAGANYRGQGGTVKELLSVTVQPNYGTLGRDADLAVIRLDGALTLGPTIQMTPILGEGIELPTGLELVLAAWGTTTQGGTVGDEGLYSLRLYSVNYDRCLITYIDKETVTENMVCAGLSANGGRDIDLRDAGAPIFYTDTAVGIVSFGVADGNDTYPVVATAIGSYTSWIVSTAV